MLATAVHPVVIEAMREIGIDLSDAKPQKLTADLARSRTGREDWLLPDPKGRSISDVRQIRDEIHEKVKALLRNECVDCVVTIDQ